MPSIAGMVAGGGIAYSASKGGMIAMTEGASLNTGVRATTWRLGMWRDPMGLNSRD